MRGSLNICLGTIDNAEEDKKHPTLKLFFFTSIRYVSPLMIG